MESGNSKKRLVLVVFFNHLRYNEDRGATV